ncbi:MAG: hypothetical protein HPY64_07765 [Anaerolineae bacterium]|nr:hypothetical protein [Anaerolineae bacterium]
MPDRFKPPQGWLWWINMVLAALLIGATLAFALVSLAVGRVPYDYGLFVSAAERFCFHPEYFRYGDAGRVYYPAPLYTALCLPARYAEPLLRLLWMTAPVTLGLWMARGRAAALLIPPLGDQLILGQSTWLLLPQYWLAERTTQGDRATFWHGLLAALGVFKPHVAALAWVWLAVRWRGQWRAYAGWLAGVLLLSVPAFVLRPDWPLAWLAVALGGRADDSTIGRASLYLVADRLGLPPLIGWAGCLLAAGLIFLALKRRRGRMVFYDWVLVFALSNPLLNAYDLIFLLPCLLSDRRRIGVALVGGVAAWVFAFLAGTFSLSIFVPLVLLVERLWRVESMRATTA